jgi:vitamin B12 transporter
MKKLLAATAASALMTGHPALAQDTIFQLDEIIFSAYADPIALDRIGTSVEVIEEDDLEAMGDVQLSDVLTRLPGVSFSEAGPPGTRSQLRIRGASAEYISVYIDGILVTDPTATEQSYDNFGGLTTGSIQRIEILRGSQSALYGGTAVGGVVNITTLAGDETPMGLSQSVEIQVGSYNTYSLDYGMARRTEDATLSLGLSHVQSDGFSAADAANGNSEEDAYDQTRLTFGYETEIAEGTTLGINGFVEEGSAEFDEISTAFPYPPIDGTPDEEADRTAYGLRLYSSYETLGGWRHEAAIAGYWIERESRSNGTPTRFEGDRITFDYGASGQISPTLTLSFGADARVESATYDNQTGGSNIVETYGGYAEATWSPTDSFDLTGTLRYDDHSAFGGQTTGRLAFAWRPTDTLVLRGAVGTGYRPPSLDELYGDYPGFFPFVGNPDLTPETSTSAELGMDYLLANGGQVGATVFLLEVDDLITYQPGAPSTLVNEPGISRRSGVELSAALPVTDWLTLTGAYTYTDARNASGGRLSNVPRHDVVLGLDAEVGQDWRLGLTAQHVADRERSSFDPEPYSDYTVVDTTASYGLNDQTELFLRIENLFDEEYQTISGYGTSGRAVYLGLRASF